MRSRGHDITIFLKINKANILFGKKTLIQKSYITNKALSTPKQVQIIHWKQFVIVALDTGNETFIVHIAI